MKAITMTYDGCQKFLLRALYRYSIDHINYDTYILNKESVGMNKAFDTNIRLILAMFISLDMNTY